MPQSQHRLGHILLPSGAIFIYLLYLSELQFLTYKTEIRITCNSSKHLSNFQFSHSPVKQGLPSLLCPFYRCETEARRSSRTPGMWQSRFDPACWAPKSCSLPPHSLPQSAIPGSLPSRPQPIQGLSASENFYPVPPTQTDNQHLLPTVGPKSRLPTCLPGPGSLESH